MNAFILPLNKSNSLNYCLKIYALSKNEPMRNPFLLQIHKYSQQMIVNDWVLAKYYC